MSFEFLIWKLNWYNLIENQTMKIWILKKFKTSFYHHLSISNQIIDQSSSLFSLSNIHRFPVDDFKSFWLSFQSTLHLSLTVLVRYRSPTKYLVLDGVYQPISGYTPK